MTDAPRHRYTMEELLDEAPPGWEDHGTLFVRAIRRGTALKSVMVMPAEATSGIIPRKPEHPDQWAASFYPVEHGPDSGCFPHFSTPHAAMAALDDWVRANT